MLYLKKAFLAAALSATLWDGALARGFNNGGSGQTSATNTGGSNTGASSDLQLNPANVQTGSDQDGQAAAGSEAGQVASATYVGRLTKKFCMIQLVRLLTTPSQ